MEWLTNPEIWVAFLTLTALEIVLGIDNIIMIAILVGRMPPHLQARTRFFGLALAMVTRIALLLSITWIMQLTNNLFHLFGQGISGRTRLAVGPARGHGVEGVGHRDDPRLDGDLLAPESVGKAAAVEPLVVRAHDAQHVGRVLRQR